MWAWREKGREACSSLQGSVSHCLLLRPNHLPDACVPASAVSVPHHAPGGQYRSPGGAHPSPRGPPTPAAGSLPRSCFQAEGHLCLRSLLTDLSIQHLPQDSL